MGKKFVVGLVVEGPNDYPVLQQVVQTTLRSVDANTELEFRNIQPQSDASSSGYQGGGWTEVFKWCLRNRPSLRRDTIFSTIIDGIPACDLLVVHLDADQLREFSAKTAVTLPASPWTAARRAGFTEKVIRSWLWPGIEPRSDTNFDKHYPLAIVWQTETWLISAIDPTLRDPEEHDPVSLIIAVEPKLEHPQRPGYLRKKGVGATYRSLAVKLANDLTRVRGACGQLEKFCSFVETRHASVIP
jgi:hypothetical protein